ncbi:MAG: surE [Chlamydiales bacterium]|jgi:5'-nucleotidase|nr:surE [Chlamydiales bacterium]
MKRPTILITNDDGVEAQGLYHLWNSLEGLGNLIVVAPSREQSAMGLALTTRSPLLIEEIRWPSEAEVYSVSGTPADTVKLALGVLLKEPPDLVVSGINRGSNEGRNVLYSGTVACVIEAALRGIPGIAFSCRDFKEVDFARFEPYIAPIVRFVLEHPLPKGSFLNVNFPRASEKISGFRLSRQGKGYWTDAPEERLHPHGSKYYWLGVREAQFIEEAESDVQLLNEGFITAVPIQIDEFTDFSYFQQKQGSFSSLFQSENL